MPTTCTNTTGNGPCADKGCCQTKLPENLVYYELRFDQRRSTSNATSLYNPCSYYFLADEDQFKFDVFYLAEEVLKSEFKDSISLGLDWVVKGATCDEARENRASYACRCHNSECYNHRATNGLKGYICSCSGGYRGNPYLKDGCQGIDIFIISFLVLTLWACIGREKRKFAEEKLRFFQQNGSLLLFEELRYRERIEFKIYRREEFEDARNNFDMNFVLGRGGYGTVYRGTLKGNQTFVTRLRQLMRAKWKNL